MKLDLTCMRYMSKEEYRVLTAVEMGMKNHELVPVELIASIAKLKHGGSHTILATLLRHKLIAHEARKYNGYRLTYKGYDVLALRTLTSRGKVLAIGNQIGVGKESDIFLAQDTDGNEIVIKLHRLGRISFRSVKKNRDYLRHRQSANWLYMSRLAAVKEFAFMRALHVNHFPTPEPIDHNRHCVCMSRVRGSPMSQIRAGGLAEPDAVFRECIRWCVKLAEHGLVHCDFNEFNLMFDPDTSKVTIIDFPQMISTSHANAKEFFDRDVGCLVKFFAMKQRYIASEDVIPVFEQIQAHAGRLDHDLEASGYTHKDGAELDRFLEARSANQGDEDEEAEDPDADMEEQKGDGDEHSQQQDEVHEEDPDVENQEQHMTNDECEVQEEGFEDEIIRRFRQRMDASVVDTSSEVEPASVALNLLRLGHSQEVDEDKEEDDEDDDDDGAEEMTQDTIQSQQSAAYIRSRVKTKVSRKTTGLALSSRNTTKKRDKKNRIVRQGKIDTTLY